MRVINDQLWCCTANGISVLEDDADTFRVNLMIPSGRLGNINDVAKLSDGSIVIAANGLYQASITGKYFYITQTTLLYMPLESP